MSPSTVEEVKAEMGMLAEAWTWLDTNSKQIGALTSVVFGVSGAVVAWVALRLNHYGNFGAKPRVVVMSAGGAMDKDGGEHFATFTCRVQNRHKYPIEGTVLSARLRSVDVRRLLKEDRRLFDGWVLHSDGEFLLQLEGKTEPGQYDEFKGKFPAELGKVFDVPLVRFSYFNSMRGDWFTARNTWRNRTAWRRRRLREMMWRLARWDRSSRRAV